MGADIQKVIILLHTSRLCMLTGLLEMAMMLMKIIANPKIMVNISVILGLQMGLQ